MLLDIVAGLLGSQLMRTVAFDVTTSLLCQVIQHTVTTATRPRSSARAAQPDPRPIRADSGPAAPETLIRPPRPASGSSLCALPQVEIVSSVSGRVRLRVPGVRGDAARAAEVAAMVRALDGVTSAQASSRTGTLLIHFAPDETSVPTIVAGLAQPLTAHPRPAQGVPYLRLVVG